MATQQTSAAYEVQASAVTELVGKDEQLTDTNYSASVGVDVTPADAGVSGEIVSVLIVLSETDAGDATFVVTGDLLIFNADPAITANSTALAAAGAEHKTLIGKVTIAAADYIGGGGGDVNGGAAFVQTAIPFEQVKTLYFSFLSSFATVLNSGATDDEVLSLVFRHRQEK